MRPGYGFQQGKMLMRSLKLLVCGGLAAAAVALPLSSASAHCCWRHHAGPVVGVVGAAGAVVEGAVSIATLPVALAADILSVPFAAADDDGPYYGGAGYYGPGYAYGPRYYRGAGYWHRRHYRRAYCCSYGY